MQQLRVVEFQQHSCDLAGQLVMHPLDEREETLSQHLLLFLWLGSCQHGCGQRLLALDNHSLEHNKTFIVYRTRSQSMNLVILLSSSKYINGKGVFPSLPAEMGPVPAHQLAVLLGLGYAHSGCTYKLDVAERRHQAEWASSDQQQP
jgi:hypothetical protein